MHKLHLLLGLILISVSLKGQENIKLHYTSNWKVTSEEKASFYREAEYDLNDFELDGEVKDYNLSGSLLMEGKYLDGKRNGYFTFYHSNGDIESEGAYTKNRRVGTWKYYYDNGRLKQVVVYRNPGNKHDFAVGEYYTKEGEQLIKNGTGKWVNDSVQTGMFDSKSYKTLKGQFKDSLKHGEWKLVRISDNKLMHNERFRKGKFIGAGIYNAQFDYYGTMKSEIINKIPDENSDRLRRTERFELDHSEFPESLLHADVETIFKTITGKEYKIQNRTAGYAYGDQSLLELIAKNIRYPVQTQMNKVAGKVYVGVVVDSKGNTKDIQLIKGVEEELDNEAIRVVKLVDKWLPAIHNGQAVESIITIPVSFQLNN